MKHPIIWNDNKDNTTIIDIGKGKVSEDFLFVDRILNDNRNLYMYYLFNEYNFLVPFNQTIKLDDRIKHILVNDIRKRFYNNQIIYHSSEYQSLYPETFYQFWEILNSYKMIDNKTRRIGFIDDGEKKDFHKSFPLGYIEATIKYAEMFIKYEDLDYIRILLNPLVKYDADKKFLSIYKHQTYEFNKSGYSPKTAKNIYRYFLKENMTFDLIMGHCDSIFRNLISMLICSKGGNMVLYVSDYLSDNYLRTIKYVSKFFKSTILYKPQIINKLDPYCYLICKDFIGLNESSVNQILQTICNEQVYNSNITSIKRKIEYAYKETILEFLNSLKINTSLDITKYFDTNDHNINNSINWLNKYHLKLNSIFRNDNQTIDDNLEYTTYTLKKNNYQNLSFPIDGTFKFSNDKIHAIKRRLNIAKRYIDTREQAVKNDLEMSIIDWNRLTDCIDIFRSLRKIISWKFGAEMISNAWTKFYEIINNENIFDKSNDSLKTFHLCEAPGTFIAALNHYLKTNTKIKNFNWYAQSLNPNLQDHNLSILGDSYGLIEKYKDRWLFGKKGTGDIMDVSVIRDYKLDKRLVDVNLITGDAGLKTPNNMFNEQESYTSKIIYAELLTILFLLPKEGSTIFKMFLPLAEISTISILYLLTTMFDEIKIVKPKTSHPSSSEIYVVCKGYHEWDTLNKNIQDRLFYYLDNFSSNESIFPPEMIPIEFLNDLEMCSELFVDKQIKSIERSIWYYTRYYNDYELQDNISIKRNIMIDEWIKENNMKPIDFNDMLL